MPAYFLESSAFVKRFAPERGSKFVLGLLRPSARNRFYAARITEVEVCAALIRRQKGKTLSADQAEKPYDVCGEIFRFVLRTLR